MAVSVVLIGSCIFYGQVSAPDLDAWGLSQGGLLAGAALLMLLQLLQLLLHRRRVRRASAGVTSPLINAGDGDGADGDDDNDAPRPVLAGWLLPRAGVAPYVQVRAVLGWAAAPGALFVLAATAYAAAQNRGAPRFVSSS